MDERSLNADKQTGALTLKDKDYNEVKVGMEVEFLLEEKNGYKNINGKSMKILNSGGAGTQQPIQQQAPQPTTTPVKEPQTTISAVDASVRCNVLQSAVMLAKGTTFENGDKASELTLIVAESFYKWVTK